MQILGIDLVCILCGIAVDNIGRCPRGELRDNTINSWEFDLTTTAENILQQGRVDINKEHAKPMRGSRNKIMYSKSEVMILSFVDGKTAKAGMGNCIEDIKFMGGETRRCADSISFLS